MKIAVAAAILLLLSGCATVMNDKTHPIRFDAMQADGTQIQDAQCTAANDKAHVTFRSGNTVQIRRSGKQLEIRCSSPGLADATGSAVSRVNAATWGNILIGGVVGAVIDTNNGKAYTYPHWVQLVFGESRLFDRRDDEDGRPVAGTITGTTPAPLVQVADARTSAQAPTPTNATEQRQPAPAPTSTSTPAPAASTGPAGSNWRSWGSKGN